MFLQSHRSAILRCSSKHVTAHGRHADQRAGHTTSLTVAVVCATYILFIYPAETQNPEFPGRRPYLQIHMSSHGRCRRLAWLLRSPASAKRDCEHPSSIGVSTLAHCKDQKSGSEETRFITHSSLGFYFEILCGSGPNWAKQRFANMRADKV